MAHGNRTTYAMSRKKLNFIIAVVIFLLVGLAVLDHVSDRSSPADYQPDTTVERNNNDIVRYHEKTFAVIKVVDGDTIDIDIPDGKYGHTRIRLWGVDTPETHKSPKGEMYFGSEASRFVTDLVLNKDVTIFLDDTRNTRGKYGRLLAYIQLPDGRILNEILITEGYAYADLRFRHDFYNKYKQLGSTAKSLKKGLWAEVTREQLPGWLQRERPKLLSK